MCVDPLIQDTFFANLSGSLSQLSNRCKNVPLVGGTNFDVDDLHHPRFRNLSFWNVPRSHTTIAKASFINNHYSSIDVVFENNAGRFTDCPTLQL